MIEDMGEFGHSTPPPPPSEQPAQPRSRSKARGAAAGVGVALVVGAGGIAVAASGSTATGTPGASPTGTASTPAPTPSHEGPGAGHQFGGGGPGGPRGPGGMGGPGGFGGAGVLHGTFVTDKTGGGTQTVQVQTGTVTTVSSTALAVKSTDGFTATYVVKAGTTVDAQRDGIASVKKGDKVSITATVSGKTATVTRVADLTELKKAFPNGGTGRGGFGGGHGPRTGGSATPTPPAVTS